LVAKKDDVMVYMWAIYFLYTDKSGGGGNELKIPEGYDWCVGARFKIKIYCSWSVNCEAETQYGIKDRRIFCGFKDSDSAKALFQSSMINKMGKAVDSVKQEVEACFTRECGLDTKVSDF